MISGYTGPLFKLRDAANAKTQDFAAISDGLPDYAAIQGFIDNNGGVAYFLRIYDQTGNGRDLTLPSLNYPAGGSAYPVDLLEKTPGGALWVNSADAISGDMVSTGHSIDNTNFSFFAVMQAASVGTPAYFWAMDDGVSTIEGSRYGGLPYGPLSWNASGNAFFSPTLTFRTNPIVIGQTNSVSSRRQYMAETSSTAAPPPAGRSTRIQYFGGTKTLNMFGYGRWAGDVLTASALSTTDGSSLQGSLAAIFGIPIQFDRRLLIIGDSIAYGFLQGLHRQMWEQMALTSASNVEIINAAVPGQTMLFEQGQAANHAALITGAYGAGRMVTVLQSGINDLGSLGNSSATQLTATANSFIGQLKSAYAGGKVLWAQLLPAASDGWDATREGSRLAYNAAVAANNGSNRADAVFLQGDIGSTMGAPATYPGGLGGAPNNATYYDPDRLHINRTGASLLAVGVQASAPSGFGNYRAAINSLWS